MSSKQRLLIIMLSCINFTHIMDFMIMLPLGSQLMREFSISPQQFSFLVSAYTFSAGIAGFIAAFFVDKFDRKHVLMFGYAGFLIGTFACAFTPTYELLAAARIVAGLFGGIIVAQVLSIIGDIFPYEQRGVAMGALMTAFSIASIAGVPFGLYLVTVFSWHAPFLFVGGLGLIILPVVYRIVPNITDHMQYADKRTNPISIVTNIAKNSNQRWALFLSVMLMLGHFSIIPFIAPYFVSNVDFTEQQLTYIYLLGGIVSFFSSPIIGKFSDKYGKYEIFAVFGVLSLVPIFLITNMTHIHIYYALMITSLFFIVAGGRVIPVQALMTSVVHPHERGSFMSINSSIQQISIALASVLAGAIVVKSDSGTLLHYDYVGYIAIVASLLCIVIARKLTPVTIPVQEPQQ